MTQYNLQINSPVDENYEHGFLPQRNNKNLFYQETSSRSNLHHFSLSSENRRIISKTTQYNYDFLPLADFTYSLSIKKTINTWIHKLGWIFPMGSVKTIFNNHIFNYLYIWKNEQQQVIAYSICYFSEKISHIAYVFYDPTYSHTNFPIRLTLQTVIDSQKRGLDYCYLGRFSKDSGYYKRTMPGFEYFKDNKWITL
ncbi:MAG: hypothetical protein WC841_01925 [Candidatus Shapirobacteria bacterium]|jgi:arginyl-tRNA--protein-N-Asp/Glu arginylyltransferase